MVRSNLTKKNELTLMRKKQRLQALLLLIAGFNAEVKKKGTKQL